MNLSDITWTCHICGERRPDNKISVFTSEVDRGFGIVITQNVRYCNDKDTCIEAAKTFSHFEERNT